MSPLDANGGLVHFPEDRESPVGGDLPNEDVNCEMPAALEGISVEVTANGKSEKLNFYTDGSGSLVRDLVGTSTFVPFEYTYEAQSEREARLVVEFPTEEGNERVVYEFRLDDGCNGSYTRTAYSGDVETGKENGRFSMRAELLIPDPERPGGTRVVANPNAIGLSPVVTRTTVLGE